MQCYRKEIVRLPSSQGTNCVDYDMTCLILSALDNENCWSFVSHEHLIMLRTFSLVRTNDEDHNQEWGWFSVDTSGDI